MEQMAVIMPMIATAWGIVLSALVGMVLANVRSTNTNLKSLNGRLADHIENKDLHYAALARTDQQIVNLLQTVKVAHERIDRIEESVHGKS